MGATEPLSPRWNLFVRELQDILKTPPRDISLSQLRYQAEIHQVKVQRLLRSLEKPKSFPTLNREELQRVIARYQITPDEQIRLRAAILATAVEALLMDRLDNNLDALHAAEQLLPLLVTALHDHAGEPDGIGTFRRGAGTMTLDDKDETATDRALEPALDAIDRATLALHLSHNVAAAAERIERARQAHDSFKLALDELENLVADDATYRENEAWQIWRDEAATGHRAASLRLADLAG